MEPLTSMWNALIMIMFVVAVLLSALVNNLILIWTTLEVSLMFITPLIISHHSANSPESMLKYFIIQIVSGLLLMTMLLASASLPGLIELLLSLKLGMVPFYSWVPHVYSGLTYFSIGALSSFMKIPTFILITGISSPSVLTPLAILSIILGSLTGVLMANLKKLLAYSSISQTGWMAMISIQHMEIWLYFMGYTIILYSVLWWLSAHSFKSTLQMFKMSLSQQIFSTISLMSMAGFPPTVGFYLKLIGLSSLTTAHPWMTIVAGLALTASVYFYFTLFLHSWMTSNKSGLKERPSIMLITISVVLMMSPFLL